MPFHHGYKAGLWYVAEVTEGTTPASAAYLHLAHKSDVSVIQAPNPVSVAKSGDVDFTSFQKGVENPVVRLTFNPSSASGKAFIKSFSSSDTPFTLLLMIDAGTDTIFARIPGCKVKNINPTVEIYPDAGAMEVTCEIWGWTILYTQVGGSPTFEAAPSTFVNWSDITVKKAAATLTDWWAVSWTIENDLFRLRDNAGVTTGIERGRRTVTGNLSRSLPVGEVGQTELDEAKNATAINVEVDIGADLYQFNSSVWREAEINHPITGMVGKKLDFQAATLVIA